GESGRSPHLCRTLEQPTSFAKNNPALSPTQGCSAVQSQGTFATFASQCL
ncbi:hypothetical protein NPIL_57161, partial [Nephila pilipes]